MGLLEIPKSTLSFSLIAFALSFFALCFFYATTKNASPESKKIGLRITSFILSYVSILTIMALGCLFFSWTGYGLLTTFVLHTIAIFISNILAVTTIFFIFFPSRSPKTLVILICLLNIAFILLAFKYPPKPFFDINSRLNWGLTFPLSLHLFYLLSISIGSMVYIFFRLFLASSKKTVRYLSLGFSISSSMGIFNVFILLVASRWKNSIQLISFGEKMVAITGILIAILFILVPLLHLLITKKRIKRIS